MLKCVHVSMCMSVTVQVLVNERQTESGEHSREQREGMRKKDDKSGVHRVGCMCLLMFW